MHCSEYFPNLSKLYLATIDIVMYKQNISMVFMLNYLLNYMYYIFDQLFGMIFPTIYILMKQAGAQEETEVDACRGLMQQVHKHATVFLPAQQMYFSDLKECISSRWTNV